MASDLQALIERVERAPGANYQLECDIKAAIDPLWPTSVPPPYTASVDAALALMERVLPGTEYEITTLYGVAQVSLPLNDANGDVKCARREDCNIPLAILASTLRAMQQENE